MQITRKSNIPKRILFTGLALVMAVSTVTATLPFVVAEDVSAVGASVVYDSLASVSPDTNYLSSGVQAHSYNELGDRVILSGDSQVLKTVSLTMSSWALKSTTANIAWCDSHPGKCTDEGFLYPMTLNAYKSDLTPVGSATVEIFIPWRPEGDPTCGLTSNGAHKGWKVADVCYNFGGKAFNAVLNVSGANITVPQDVVLGFAYNTQTKGYAPTGETGPINSINIAYPNTSASVGTDQNTNEAYVSTSTPATWGVAGTGFQTTDFGPGYGFGIRVTAESDVPETTLDVKTGNGNSVNALSAGVVGDKFTVSGVATDNNDLSRVYVQLNKSTGGRFGGTTVHLNGTNDDWSVDYDASSLGFVDGDKIRAHVSVTDTTGKTKSVGWTEWMTVDFLVPGAPVITNSPVYVNATQSYSLATWSHSGADVDHFEYREYIDADAAATDSAYWVQTRSASERSQVVGHSWTGEKTLYYRIVAVDVAGNRSASSTLGTVIIDKSAPDSPIPVSPANGTPINGSSPLTNDWGGVSDAVRYIYQSYNVKSDGTCNLANIRWTATYTDSQTNSRSLADGLKYCWRVKAVDAAGNESAWSELWKTVVDNTKPVVALVDYNAIANVITPNITVDDASLPLTYSWSPVNQASDDNVDISALNVINPEFTVNVDGTYSFELVVTDAAGNSTTQLFTFTYTTPAPEQEPVTNDDEGDGNTDDDNNTSGANTANAGGFTGVDFNDGIVPEANDEDVLGVESSDNAQSNDEEDAGGEVLGSTTEKSDGLWSPLGIVWYWWLLILAGTLVVLRLFVALVRRLRAEEA
jgi:hypothetical protein